MSQSETTATVPEHKNGTILEQIERNMKEQVEHAIRREGTATRFEHG